MGKFSKELRSDKYQRILETQIEDLSPTELQELKSDIESLLPELRETDIATSSRTSTSITAQWFNLRREQLVEKLSMVEKKINQLKTEVTPLERIQQISNQVEELKELRRYLNRVFLATRSQKEVTDVEKEILDCESDIKSKEEEIAMLEAESLADDINRRYRDINNNIVDKLESPNGTKTAVRLKRAQLRMVDARREILPETGKKNGQYQCRFFDMDKEARCEYVFNTVHNRNRHENSRHSNIDSIQVSFD